MQALPTPTPSPALPTAPVPAPVPAAVPVPAADPSSAPMLPEPIARHDVHLIDIGSTPVSVGTVIVALAAVVISFGISMIVRQVLRRALHHRHASDGEIRALLRIVHYAILLIGFSIGLSTAGVNLGALFAAGAVFAVAIGFAMQDIAQNFVSGLILLMGRVIKPNDVLEVDGEMVRVERVGLRTTFARTLDDEVLVIPNSSLVQNTLKNVTLRDATYRIRVTVGVSYSSDMALVRDVLTKMAAGVEWQQADREPRILLTEFGDSSVNWEVSVWTDDPWRKRQWRSDLHERIWQAFQKAEITIAFPQMDLHLDEQVVTALGRDRQQG